MAHEGARPPDEGPYKGLQPYTEEDQDYFFGRARDVEILVANLLAAPLTILYGASGVGKTSVLQAGVIPRLRREPRVAVVMYRDWQVPDVAAALKAGIVRAIAAVEPSAPAVDPALPLDEFLARSSHEARVSVLFVLDQFEEYTFYVPVAPDVQGMDAELARAINRHDVDANFLLALRQDNLSTLERFQQRIPNLMANMLRLGHLDAAAAREAVVRPIEQFNELEATPSGRPSWSIEEGLPAQVLGEVQGLTFGDRGRLREDLPGGPAPAGRGPEEEWWGAWLARHLPAPLRPRARPGGPGPGEPGPPGPGAIPAPRDPLRPIETPALQLVLTRLWQEEQRAGLHRLRLHTLDVTLGGAAHIVRTHLDGQMRRLPRGSRPVAAAVFDGLVTEDGRKIAQTPRALAERYRLPIARVEPVLIELCRGRTPVLRQITDPFDPAGEARFEIYHDVLAQAVLDWSKRFNQRRRLLRAVTTLLAIVAALGSLTLWIVSLYLASSEAQSRQREILAARVAQRVDATLGKQPELAQRLVLVGLEALRLTEKPSAEGFETVLNAAAWLPPVLNKGLDTGPALAYGVGSMGLSQFILADPELTGGATTAGPNAGGPPIGAIVIAETASGQVTAMITPESAITAAAFLDDGRMAVKTAEGTEGGRTWILKTDAGRHVSEVAMSQSFGLVPYAEISPQGYHLAVVPAPSLPTGPPVQIPGSSSVAPPETVVELRSATDARPPSRMTFPGRLFGTGRFSPDGTSFTVVTRPPFGYYFLPIMVVGQSGSDSFPFAVAAATFPTSSGREFTSTLVQTFATASGQSLGRIQEPAAVLEASPAPGNRHLALVTAGSEEHVFDAATGRELWSLAIQGPPDYARLSADGRHLAAVGWDHRVTIWDVDTGRRVGLIDPLIPTTFGVLVAPGGRFVLTADRESTVRLWDVRARQQVEAWDNAILPFSLPGIVSRPWRIVSFEPGGGRVVVEQYIPQAPEGASGGRPGTYALSVYDPDAKKTRGRTEITGATPLRWVLRPDGRTWVAVIAESPSEMSLRVVDLEAPERDKQEVRRNDLPPAVGRQSAFSQDGAFLASAGGDAKEGPGADGSGPVSSASTVWIRDTETGEETWQGRAAYLVTWLALSSDGRSLAYGGIDRPVTLVRPGAEPAERELTLGRGGGAIREGVFSPDGTILSLIEASGRVRTYNVTSGTEVPPATAPEGVASKERVCASGIRLHQTCQINRVRIVEMASGREIKRLEPGRTIQSTSFNRDGALLAMCGPGREVQVWDVAAGRVLTRIPCPEDAAGWFGPMAWSPAGDRLALTDLNGTILVADARDGRALEPLRHDQIVVRLDFHPLGRHLLTQRSDNTLTVWELSEVGPSRAVARLHPTEFPAFGPVCFGPEGRLLVGVAFRYEYSDRITVRPSLVRFPWQVDGLRAMVLPRLMREAELTPAERAQYVLPPE